MASLSSLATATAGSSSPPFFPRLPSRKATPIRRLQTRCEQGGGGGANATDTSRGGDDNASSLLRLDRRNVLLGGLGGSIYGAASLLGGGQAAVGAPITIPDLTACHTATASGVGDVECCPPYTDISSAIDYTPPSSSKPLRVRKPAHLLTDEEIEKYKEAYSLMRALPDDDPRSLKQQADVHCQYCNGAYYQTDTTTVLQVHYNWFFSPWHRLYLHFHERILGSLIGDDSFALPFWNWDSGLEGMKIPAFFTNDTSSSLYDEKRNLNHYPPAVIDFEYSFGDTTPTDPDEIEALIQKNLLQIRKAYTESLSNPELFLGGAIRAGEEGSYSGSLELIHNGAHVWVGPDESPNMNMGNFYSAGRDPIFYCHHSNVDRMWSIYRAKRGYRVDFDDSDWLDSTFVFVDENQQLVKCKVSDSLSTLNMRYVYEEVSLPWDNTGVRKKVLKNKAKTKAKETTLEDVTEFGSSSRSLTSTIRALVSRPQTSRSKSEKEEAAEVLIVSGIVTAVTSPSRFDVYVTTPYGDDQVSSDLGELAGCFIELPHHAETTDGETATHVSNFRVGITGLLEDLDAEDATKLVVSLVPRFGDITVGGVEITLLETDSSSE